MVSFDEALASILSGEFVPETEEIALSAADGRVLAEPVVADRDYPPFNRAAVDGIAIRGGDLSTENRGSFRIVETIYAGDHKTPSLAPGESVHIMTGAVVPADCDQLYKIEDCEVSGDVAVLPDHRNNPPKQFLNIHRQGKDLNRGDTVYQPGAFIDFRTIATLAALGYSKIKVFSPLRVSVVSTGSELVSVDEDPKPWQIRDSNYYALDALFRRWGVQEIQYFRAPDDLALLKESIQKALASDIVVVTGGVSMGKSDYVPEVLGSLGVKEVFHKISIKPGKPVWFGKGEKTMVFALPGNPLSAVVTAKLLIEPWLKKIVNGEQPSVFRFPLLSTRVLKGDRPEFFPVRLVSGVNGVLPVDFSGSGDITATAGSDGIALHPVERKEITEGELVEVRLW